MLVGFTKKIENISKEIGGLPKLTLVQDTFFLYDNHNLIKNILLKKILKRNSNNEIDLITPEDKSNFSIAQENFKEKFALQLAKVSGKNIFTTSNKMKYFGILTIRKEKKCWLKKINV